MKRYCWKVPIWSLQGNFDSFGGFCGERLSSPDCIRNSVIIYLTQGRYRRKDEELRFESEFIHSPQDWTLNPFQFDKLRFVCLRPIKGINDMLYTFIGNSCIFSTVRSFKSVIKQG